MDNSKINWPIAFEFIIRKMAFDDSIKNTFSDFYIMDKDFKYLGLKKGDIHYNYKDNSVIPADSYHKMTWKELYSEVCSLMNKNRIN